MLFRRIDLHLEPDGPGANGTPIRTFCSVNCTCHFRFKSLICTNKLVKLQIKISKCKLQMRFALGMVQRVRSEKLQNESFPNFRIFVPNFAPNFAPNFPRIFRGLFVLRFVGDGDHKNSPKIPAIFQCKIPRQTRKKYSQNSSGEQAE